MSDNSLAGHLGVFGINVAEQEKTEKTVMEMVIIFWSKRMILNELIIEFRLEQSTDVK